MSEKKVVLDIKHDKWPRCHDILTDVENYKSFSNFEHNENILGDVPERINEHVKGKKGKNVLLGIGKP